jgi:DNA-binding transcriptional regulator LsrR (DeoR family)
MARIDELRLMAKVARLYYGQRLRQTEMVDRLNLSQSTISRLLKRAEREGIVRIMVSVPPGTYAELEEALQERFNLKDAIVVDGEEDNERIVRDLGAAAAFYVETTIQPGEVVGISSWSAALLAMVDSMNPSQRAAGATVVQILGGIGNPAAEVHATHLTQRLANLIGGTAKLLPAPGVVGSAEAKRVLLNDRYVAEALDLMKSVSLALVGIGGLEPSRLLASSGNVFSPKELRSLSALGAVGDICLHFYDAEGKAVRTPLSERVIGMDLQDLRRSARVVGIAGGSRKLAAIRGALKGKWINVLITDRYTAESLLAQESSQPAGRPVPVGARAERKR